MVRWISIYAWHCCQHFQDPNVLEVVRACKVLQHLEVQLLISLMNCEDLKSFLCFANIWVNHLIYGEWWNVWMCRMDMLLVFQWPNLMLVLDDPKAFKSIQNLDIKCPFSLINILQSLKVKAARCMVFLPISRRWFCVFLVCNWIELCYGVKKVGGHSLSLMWCLKLLCLNLGHAFGLNIFGNNFLKQWMLCVGNNNCKGD